MDSLEELEIKKQQKLEERRRKARERYHRTKHLKPLKPRKTKIYIKFCGVRCGSKNFPLVLDCFSKKIPFVNPVTKKIQYFDGMIDKSKIGNKEECSIPLQHCEPSKSGTVMDTKSITKEDPKIISGPTESCSNSANKVVVK